MLPRLLLPLPTCLFRWRSEFRTPTYTTTFCESISKHHYGYVDLTLQHRSQNGPCITGRFLVASKITGRIPSNDMDHYFARQLSPSDLADPTDWIPAKVDMLIGMGIWANISTGEVIRNNVGGTVMFAIKTMLGSTIGGSKKSTNSSNSIMLHTCLTDGDQYAWLQELDLHVKKFWENENITETRISNANEQLAEDIFMSTHSRDETGLYMVTIPFKLDAPDLGNSKIRATTRLMKLEGQLKRQVIHDFLMDYLRQVTCIEQSLLQKIQHACIMRHTISFGRKKTGII
jgi:hypothetical protein